ncbi:hypothetical protein [Herpetosiphon gulosus]|uniref:Uncharacterized protein n=1 Tax=Herpetosiphon gulosus TaxID=1973496 RepID=A0ABP9X7F5_9CHLR
MTNGESATGRRDDTIADYMKILARDWELEDWFVWPPDTFAFTSLLLKKTGIYTLVIDLPDGEKWPDNSDEILPTEHCDCKETKILYEQAFETIQFEWFNWIQSDDKPTTTMPPILFNIKEEMQQLYTIVHIDELYSLTIQNENGFGIDEFNQNAWRYCQLLLSLHMLADQACAGMGTPSANRLADDTTKIAHGVANMFLTLHGSLSRLPILTVRVLPKMRTSRSGITLRSLSHHVTAHRTEVDIQWRTMPWVNIDDNTLNILIVPWPYHIKSSSFSPSNYTVNRDTKERTRYFQYHGEREKFTPAALISMIQNSQKNVARIHLIVFPEAALDEQNFDSLLWALQNSEDLDRTQLPMVLAGIHDSTSERSTKLGRNKVILATFFAGKWYKMRQDKHHRWKLNPPQITRYGLSGVLGGENDWWEAIHIPKRRLSVLAPNNWLTLCPLICEDLARLEPVSELIRGIGPTLLIALLMDGPQLKSRWPSRYATVMADDPGTSVLSVSSLGLVRVSPDKDGKTGSQVIALWNDQESGLKEISVDDPESGGVILTISAVWNEEITADGRSDNHNAAVFTFQNTYQVRSGAQNHNIELNLNKNFNQSDKNDLQEISIFSSFIDTIFDLNDTYCDEIKSWIVDDTREFEIKSTIGKMYKDLFDIFKDKYNTMNHHNTTSDHEDLDTYINWIFNAIIEIKKKYKVRKENIYEIFVDIVGDILNKVEGYKFVSDVFNEKSIYISYNNINIDIMKLFNKEKDEIPNHRKIRIIIYDCLAILWTIHTRLNYLRKHGNFHQKHAELSHQIEQLWAEKYDEKWLLARQREKK